MTAEPIDMDASLLRDVRAAAGVEGAEAFVDQAVRNELQRYELGVLLAEVAADAGPVPDDLEREAEAFWHAG